jgi:hypothetical protein
MVRHSRLNNWEGSVDDFTTDSALTHERAGIARRRSRWCPAHPDSTPRGRLGRRSTDSGEASWEKPHRGVRGTRHGHTGVLRALGPRCRWRCRHGEPARQTSRSCGSSRSLWWSCRGANQGCTRLSRTNLMKARTPLAATTAKRCSLYCASTLSAWPRCMR